MTGSGDYVGGLVGGTSNWGSASNSFWDIYSSGQSSSATGTGKTTVEMKIAGTFVNAGWDFELETGNGSNNYWDMNQDGTNYPVLSWQDGATVLITDLTAPGTPTGLVATPGDAQVVLTWTANGESDVASYKVFGGNSASPTTLLSTVTSGQTSTQTSLTNQTTYYYRITAVDDAGNESDKTSDVSSLPHDTDGSYGLSFDGNDKVILTGISSSDAAGSLSLWVYPTDIYIENIVFQDTDADLVLYLHETKGVCFGINTISGREELCQSVTISD